MARSGVKLKAAKVEKIWQLFAAGISIASIARKLKVSHTTISKYRDREGWINRRDKINRRASKKLDTQAVNLQAENLKIVRTAKNKLAKQIKALNKKSKTNSKTPYADLDKMIRLEAFLGGQPDSRPAQPEPKEELARMSVEQLIVIHNNLISGNGHKRKKIASKVKPGGQW